MGGRGDDIHARRGAASGCAGPALVRADGCASKAAPPAVRGRGSCASVATGQTASSRSRGARSATRISAREGAADGSRPRADSEAVSGPPCDGSLVPSECSPKRPHCGGYCLTALLRIAAGPAAAGQAGPESEAQCHAHAGTRALYAAGSAAAAGGEGGGIIRGP